ncbi:Dabb family protein [Frondihabitans australicus]|uniref:Stress responsive alpha/beta barrel protein n=1 Tax=Frondihabitans australicus TaxID=386892 RepID=A0A495IIZ9_9MICO|nr:Dabb family protein [Frondihabitans australicus]RKR75974.1 stress responsive alpha/beta barrel protein [Frondihabitans australicus]
MTTVSLTTRNLTGTEAAEVTARDYRPGLVRHVVLFRFREGVDQAAQEQAEARFRALADAPRHDGAPYVVSIVAGPQTSPEDTDHVVDLGFIVTFASEGDRNYYVGQPVVTDPAYFCAAHDAYKAFVGPLLDDVIVFDLIDPADR